MSEPGSRPKIGWIVALSGMLVIPVVGLVWAAVSGGPPDVTAEDEDAATADEEDGGSTATAGASAAKKKKKSTRTSATKAKAKTKAKTGTRRATHEAASCCEALRKAGRDEADISKRPTFLAAASACEAAPTGPRAMSQVKSIVEGSRLELPADCSE